MNKWTETEIEAECEGKMICTLSACRFGMIIHFTDGSCLKYINGTLKFEEVKS